MPLTTDIHNPFTASVGFFMCLAVRLGIIWEPIPNPAFPGFEPGTSTMPSEHVGTELTGPQEGPSAPPPPLGGRGGGRGLMVVLYQSVLIA